MRAQIGLLLAACLGASACSTETPKGVDTAKAAPVSAAATLERPDLAPQCITQGCCAGHGEVAYIQPDRFIMCTDGEPSRICDCH